MITHSRAIVLSVIRYGDDKLICRLLTEQDGCLSFMVRRGRGRGSRHRLFRPLAMLSVEWDKTGRDRLVHPKSVAPLETYATIPYEPEKASVAMFLCEFLNAALRKEPPGGGLFSFVENALRFYDRVSERHANFHLVFLLNLSAFLGLQPDAGGYTAGSHFDMRDGCFTPHCPQHPDFIPSHEASVLPALLRMNFANMHLFRLNGRERSRLLQYLVAYYRLHIPDFPELKSLQVLRDIWDTKA